MYRIVCTKQTAKATKNLKAASLSIKAKKIIKIIRDEPFRNPPPYEGLVGNLDGFYSRGINIKYRLAYQV
nr:hypothetical protein [Clostridium sp. C105KSO13]